MSWNVRQFVIGAVLFFLAGGVMANEWVYIGGYTTEANEAMKKIGAETSQGINVADYDAHTGELSNLRPAAKIDSPNFFSLSPNRDVLYTCCGGEENLAAFKIDSKTGDLTLINRAANGSVGCCHVEVSPDGKWIVSANYTGGDFSINRINADGSLGEITECIQKPGTGPDVKRQQAPFGHAGYFVPDGDNLRLLLVDLGTDRVHVMRFDSENGTASDDPDIPTLFLPAGAGCRHLAWTKIADSTFDVFVNNELDSTVSFFTLEFGKGSDGLTYWGTWLTVPEVFRGKVSWDQSLVDADENYTLMNSTAETVCRRAVGDFPPVIYVSNRGHNSIAVFQIVEKNGIRALKPIQYAATGGDAPRFFMLDKEQKHAIVANKRTGTVRTFTLADDGTFAPTGFEPVKIGWPCALAILP